MEVTVYTHKLMWFKINITRSYVLDLILMILVYRLDSSNNTHVATYLQILSAAVRKKVIATFGIQIQMQGTPI